MHYEARPPKHDCDSIIVIFSSIRGKNSWLDFDGIDGHALKTNRARLLFIYDDFSDEYTYYAMKSGTESVQVATEEFLREYLEIHNYNTERAIFAGLSKGATAALLIGTRFPGSPIVALAPQIALGQYLNGRTDLIFENMIGPRTQTNMDELDRLVPNAISQDVDRSRPLYILTSPNDSNCYERANSILSNYKNANLIVTPSKRAVEHATTLHYLLPTFLPLLGLLSSGLYPNIGPSIDELRQEQERKTPA